MAEPYQLRRVTAGIGWAVHALIFEFDDGRRTGRILSNSGMEMSLTDESIRHREADRNWIDVERGDYVVRVRGRNLSTREYLCHEVTLDFASGQSVTFKSRYNPWRGNDNETFSYDVPHHEALLRDPIFEAGRCTGLQVVRTSVHRPITQEGASLLPKPIQDRIELVLLVANRVDADRAENGGAAVGTDVWWTALGMIKGMDMLPHAPRERTVLTQDIVRTNRSRHQAHVPRHQLGHLRTVVPRAGSPQQQQRPDEVPVVTVRVGGTEQTAIARPVGRARIIRNRRRRRGRGGS